MGDARAQNLLADGEGGVLAPDRFINISPTNGANTIGTFNVNDNGAMDLERNRDRVFADLVNVNEWVHAVLVINGPGSGKANVLYLNGVAKESTGGGDEWADADEAIMSPKHILASPEGLHNAHVGRSSHEQNGDQIMNGWIDDIAIFNVALTAEQVAELMAHDFKAPAAVEQPAEEELGTGGGDPADIPAPVVEAPAPAPAAPAPVTADPVILLVLGSLVSAAGAIIAKKRK